MRSLKPSQMASSQFRLTCCPHSALLSSLGCCTRPPVTARRLRWRCQANKPNATMAATPTIATGTATATTGNELLVEALLAVAATAWQLLALEGSGLYWQMKSPATHKEKVAFVGSVVHMSGLPGCITICSNAASCVQLAGTVPVMLLPFMYLQTVLNGS